MSRYRDASASTADFVALAEEVSGRQLDGFMNPWLYGAKTPPMPGEPEWKSVDPAKTVKKAHKAAGKTGGKSAGRTGGKAVGRAAGK